MVHGKAYEYDRQLADEIGPRLTGSDNYVHSVRWAEQQFQQLGLSNIHTESWKIPATWEPEEPAVGHLVTPREQQLHIYSLGWSPSTPPEGVSGEVVYLEHLSSEGITSQQEKLVDHIVLIDRHSLGEDPDYAKVMVALEQLQQIHLKAVLMTGGPRGAQSQLAFTQDGSIFRFPAAQLGAEDTTLIRRMLERGPVKLEFHLKNRIRKEVEIHNVVAEIPGTDLPKEVVLIGGHLDSWEPGTGAQDNGTGVAAVLEAARAMKAEGQAPRRTVRFVLFGGEEQGLLGSLAYVKQHRQEMPLIDCVLMTDSGAEPAKGWYVMGRDDEQEALKNVEPLLQGLGSGSTSPDLDYLFETDHAAFDMLGVPTLVLWTGMEQYATLHHKASDTFDSVKQADLNQGTATVAATAYAIAASSASFAPHQSAAQVEAWLKKNKKQWDAYQFYQSRGLMP